MRRWSGPRPAAHQRATADNFWSKARNGDPGPNRMMSPWFLGDPILNWEKSASGYAGIRAIANTREALFAAMKRKETFATTGPRMSVRFFGGRDYAPSDTHRPNLARIGYADGVPMGGVLSRAPVGRAPRFLIHAAGAVLDQVEPPSSPFGRPLRGGALSAQCSVTRRSRCFCIAPSSRLAPDRNHLRAGDPT